MMGSKIAAGTKVYDVSHKAVSAVGFVMGTSEVERALRTRVAERLSDPEGAAIIASALEGLEEAEFDRHHLEHVLAVELPDDPWRIGEALAECYLEDHNECLFPWPAQRDLRNPKASPAGADLAGFRGQGEKARFAFGEVKTSEDTSAPPNVMYGRSGMVKQLEDLCHDEERISALIRYLGIRHVKGSWTDSFKTALIARLKSPSDIFLVGVLVRTTPANSEDLRSRAISLGTHEPKEALLMALYVPVPLAAWKATMSSGGEEKPS